MSSKSVYQSWKHTDLISELPRYVDEISSQEVTTGPHSFRTSSSPPSSSSSSEYHYSRNDPELFMGDDDDSMYAEALMASGLFSEPCSTSQHTIFDSPDDSIPNGRLKMLLAHMMNPTSKDDTKGKGRA